MKKKKILKIIINLIFNNNNLVIFIQNIFKKDKILLSKQVNPNSITKLRKKLVYNSNIIERYKLHLKRFKNGNEYILVAKEGEIDLDNSDIIFLD